MLRARADKVVVHHQNTFLTDALEFADDIGDGPLAVMSPVERRHAAEAAVQGTAARGLNRAEGIPFVQQIVLGEGDGVDLREAAVIPALQTAVLGVLEDLRPDALGFARDDRVHALHGLVQAHGCVNTAHDDRHAQAPEVRGHFIGPVRLRGESSDAHQVRQRHRRIVRHAEVLVNDRDFPLRRGQARKNHKAERFPHPVTVPAAFPDSDDADERVGRIDQI